MKQIYLLLFIFLIGINQNYGQYSVKIRIGEITISNPVPDGHEWKCPLTADIFDSNGNLIPAPTGTIFAWYFDYCDGYGFILKSVNQETGSDGMISQSYTPKCDYSLEFQTYWVRLDVTIDGNTYSDDIRVPDNGAGILEQKMVIVRQNNKNNISTGRFSKNSGGVFLNYPSPFTFYYPYSTQGDIFRASQTIISNEKYSKWIDIADIINHKSMPFLNNQQLFTAQLNEVVNATLKVNSSEYLPLQPKFKDPWFINDYSDPLGPRNKGINADTLFLPNIDNNLSITSEHQGVLLNQDYNIPGQPYYSISIPSSINLPQNGGIHNIYLQNWDVTGATLQNANSLTTGVVFTSSSGASVTANVKATQLSNNANAFANNSQRKLIKTPDGVMHLVYESMGHIWYETSTNNGTTWQLMNGGKPLDSGAGKCPAIDYSYNTVAIVYQEKSGDNSNLQIKAFLPVNGQYVYNFGTILTSAGLYSSDANPVIGWSSSSKLVVIWKSPSYLSYICGDLDVGIYSSSFTFIDSGIIGGSNSLSQYPSISVDKFDVGSAIRYALVWQQGFSNGQSAIYYSPISVVYQSGTPPPIEAASVAAGSAIVQPDAIGYWYFVQSSTSNISSGTTAYNYKPSVI